MQSTGIQQMTAQVFRLMGERLGAHGATLADRLASRGGSLPAKVRRAVEALAQAEQMAASPKLARQLDPAEIARAHRTCVKYLKRLGAGERRRSLALNVAATLVLGLVILAAGIITVLRLRGFV
ncbi:hypothetical protein D2T31_12255 [Sinirhodobacter populi]|uniref:Transmembrane protein n=1 Tax=Paenirhodobacter populi TaxID=2306993 RepID=A0A443K7X1_9RHOB|nr:hypothetical protein [Sinirhodobacter populi]RWR28877.1 hypothetical protein D2T31_12255 [Sinirhodobacter populi]